jgi:glyoxylase-like metal-dependent hydrolase (beta-lactamase superfamily II)
MITDTYRFRLGTFECISISDGSLNYPPQNFFANVPKAQLDDVLRQHDLPTDHITTPYTCLYVNTGTHRVMVDVGAGNLAPSTGRLLQNMKAAGIEPSAIDTVIITHAHPDHIGGNLDQDDQPLYPNARYFMWKEEWDFWTTGSPIPQAPEFFFTLARNQLEPVRDRLTLLDREAEIVPGIEAIAAPGHTPGHIALSILSDGQRLLHVSDLVLYPLHLEYPDWVPIYDILPDEAATSKRRIFDRAAEQKSLVFAHHFPPFPNLGYVIKTGDGWQWQPFETSGQANVDVTP